MTVKRKMPKRAQQPLPASWHREEHFVWNGRHIEPGTELKIRGARGRWRFVSHTRKDDGAEWIDVIGGTRGAAQWRSFRPDLIRTVHRTKKTITAREARELVNSKNRAKREAKEGEE